MASNGLEQRAKAGVCRICQRRRSTEKHVKEVGEVRHGFATGYIWECIDAVDCEQAAKKKLKNKFISGRKRNKITTALEEGRFKEYKVFV